MSKILVTGGTGFIGAALVKQLVFQGHHVRVFDNNFRGNTRRISDVFNQVECIWGDIREPQIVFEAVKDVDVVYHLAFINGTRYFYEKPDLVLEVGLKGTLNVLDAIKKWNTPRYIFASSAEVYQVPTHTPTTETERLIVPDPKNPRYSYGGAKLIGEILSLHYLQMKNTSTVIFRPHNIYGPDMGLEHVIPEFIVRMKELSQNFTQHHIEFPIQGSGNETRAFCYIDDAARGIALLGEKGVSSDIYHIGTETEVTIREVALVTARLLGIETTLIPSKTLEGSTPRRCPSIQKISALGYSPTIGLEEGIKKTSDWYIRNTL